MIRVIGLGSPFGDDRVGWRVIELLEDRLPKEVDLVALDRPGAALINWMQGVDHLLLVDALSSGANPGSVVRLDPMELGTESGRLTSHELALSETLRLASSLGCLPARMEIYGIELCGYTDEGLSTAAEAAAAELTSLIVESIN